MFMEHLMGQVRILLLSMMYEILHEFISLGFSFSNFQSPIIPKGSAFPSADLRTKKIKTANSRQTAKYAVEKKKTSIPLRQQVWVGDLVFLYGSYAIQICHHHTHPPQLVIGQKRSKCVSCSFCCSLCSLYANMFLVSRCT